ncbi:MAG: glutathione S-transferase [Polynucleobacter sp.]|nr:MAG: glutathione S-transferase [Polynucleobacter sp.]
MSAVLYSYRRCPYAMRARMALAYAQIPVEIREISLREKPASMLAISPKGTVPVLQCGELVIEQSLEIMFWALQKSDPDQWLKSSVLDEAWQLIELNDSSFKALLDQYKYPERIKLSPSLTREAILEKAIQTFIAPLEERLGSQPFLFGEQISIADIAIFPFIRQFAMVDKDWFDSAPFPRLKKWLDFHLESPLFLGVMQKYPTWQDLPLESS